MIKFSAYDMLSMDWDCSLRQMIVTALTPRSPTYYIQEVIKTVLQSVKNLHKRAYSLSSQLKTIQVEFE